MWSRQIKKMRRDFKEYHKIEQEEHRTYHRHQEELQLKLNSLKVRKRELQKHLRFIRRFPGPASAQDENELLRKIAGTDTKIKELHLKLRLNPFRDNDESFDNYYRHIRNTRPFFFIFNLLLWFLLFWFGGIATGLKIIVFIFAFLTTSGSIFEMLFLIRIKERILKPVDTLIKGVNEIAQGNNKVVIHNEYHSEISSLINAFNEMAVKLQEAEILKSEYEDNRKALIANISHDLKTPITSIQGYAEMITSGIPMEDEQKDRYLKIIYNNAIYMNRLIEDLFLFSKLDMQKLDFHFEELPIRPLIHDMMEEFGLDLYEQKIGFHYTDTLNEEYTVKLDAKRFFQIIHNIMGNAVTHCPETELTISVKLYTANDSVCLDISDNGPGIPDESLPHIFERFYRSEAERTKSLSSTGLGLAIAKELVQAHEGKITVSSKLNEGSCFTIYLPCVKKIPL